MMMGSMADPRRNDWRSAQPMNLICEPIPAVEVTPRLERPQTVRQVRSPTTDAQWRQRERVNARQATGPPSSATSEDIPLRLCDGAKTYKV